MYIYYWTIPYSLTFRKRKILKIDKKCGCCYLVGKIAKDARPKIT
jgi:hypothetical protein